MKRQTEICELKSHMLDHNSHVPSIIKGAHLNIWESVMQETEFDTVILHLLMLFEQEYYRVLVRSENQSQLQLRFVSLSFE